MPRASAAPASDAGSPVSKRYADGMPSTAAIATRPTGHSRPPIRRLNGTRNARGSGRNARSRTSAPILRSAAQTTPTAYAPAIQRTWPAVATTIASAPAAVRSMRRDGVPKRGWSARIDPASTSSSDSRESTCCAPVAARCTVRVRNRTAATATATAIEDRAHAGADRLQRERHSGRAVPRGQAFRWHQREKEEARRGRDDDRVHVDEAHCAPQAANLRLRKLGRHLTQRVGAAHREEAGANRRDHSAGRPCRRHEGSQPLRKSGASAARDDGADSPDDDHGQRSHGGADRPAHEAVRQRAPLSLPPPHHANQGRGDCRRQVFDRHLALESRCAQKGAPQHGGVVSGRGGRKRGEEHAIDQQSRGRDPGGRLSQGVLGGAVEATWYEERAAFQVDGSNGEADEDGKRAGTTALRLRSRGRRCRRRRAPRPRARRSPAPRRVQQKRTATPTRSPE